MSRLVATSCIFADSALTIASVLSSAEVSDAAIWYSVAPAIGIAVGIIGQRRQAMYFALDLAELDEPDTACSSE